MFRFMPITRSPAQKPAHKDLGRNGQNRAARLCPLMFWFTPITRSPAQKPAHKDLGRNGQNRAITTKATYAPVSNRVGSRLLFLGGFPLADYIKQIRAKVGHTPLIMAGVIGILADEAGRVLFQQRSDFKGQWGLISGTIEYGETPAQTMIREFKEETNLTVKVVSLLGVDGDLTLTYPNGDVAQWLCPVFLVKQLGGELSADNDETEQLQYFAPSEAPRLFNQQHRAALAHFIADETGYFD